MNAAKQDSSSLSETLQARKAYLTALLKIVDTKIGKGTSTQKLTIIAIKAEMGLIEHKLKKIDEDKRKLAAASVVLKLDGQSPAKCDQLLPTT